MSTLPCITLTCFTGFEDTFPNFIFVLSEPIVEADFLVIPFSEKLLMQLMFRTPNFVLDIHVQVQQTPYSFICVWKQISQFSIHLPTTSEETIST